MTTLTRKPTTKTVSIIARYQFKSDTKKVAYLVKSSDGATTYY